MPLGKLPKGYKIPYDTCCNVECMEYHKGFIMKGVSISMNVEYHSLTRTLNVFKVSIDKLIMLQKDKEVLPPKDR